MVELDMTLYILECTSIGRIFNSRLRIENAKDALATREATQKPRHSKTEGAYRRVEQ